ncbi:hypothetical protein ACFL00_04520 [Pseudomonadota bacterium]
MVDKIPSDLAVLSDAYGLHIRALGKYWALAATVAVVAYTADVSVGKVELFGFKLEALNFYPVCAVFGAILNFAYGVSHLQAYRAGIIFRLYLKTINADDVQITPRNTLTDAAHLLYPSAVNRIYPVFSVLPASVSKTLVRIVKLPIDLFVFLVPIAGCLYATSKINFEWWVIIVWFLVAVSGLISILLTYTGLRWLLLGDEGEEN